MNKPTLTKRSRVLLATATLLTLMTSSSGAMAEVFLFKFGSTGSGDGQFNGPTGIAVDAAGDISVADPGNVRVQKFDSSGNFLLQFFSQVRPLLPPIISVLPVGIAVDSTGSIYVADPENRLVQKLDPSGNFLRQIEPVCTVGVGDCIDPDDASPRPTVYRPTGVAADAFDNLYVIGTFHLQKFNPAGNLQIEFPLGAFVWAAIAVDSDDNIILSEADGGFVEKYDPAGNLLLQLPATGCNVAEGFGCVDPDGGGPLELGDGQFAGLPTGIAVDVSNNIYVTDYVNARVQKLSPSGQFLLKFGTPGSGDGQFGPPSSGFGSAGIAVDTFGKIYVVDSGNNRIQVFGAVTDTGSVDSATGAGPVTFTTSAGAFSSLIAVAEGSLPAAGKPMGVTFPFGFFDWTVTDLTLGQTVTITITYPTPIAPGAQYWKVINGTWTNVTSLLGSDNGDNVLALTITDGGPGDADGVANGQILDPGGVASVGLSVPTEVPFAALAAKLEVDDDEFELKATFTPGAASNGINPLTEAVTLHIGPFALTIPAGSFRQDRKGRFKFEGAVGGVELEAQLLSLSGGGFQFTAEGSGADLSGVANPVTVGLTIGNDGGSTSVTAELDD